MNRAIFWLKNGLVRVFLTLSFVAIAFLFSAALGDSNSLQAKAEPMTPETTQYQVNSNESPFRENEQEKVNQIFEENKNPQTTSETTQKIGENLSKSQKTIKQNLESAGDTIREKLNLDQPLYPGTKEVLNDAAEAVRGD